ncbi:MAG: septal ring lytic transglycosylase RlpA family protein [Sphingobacteriia bacterium]|nr:septal ring lytic transglycosylase RlpA family protein [Sphingobacteriia bacterium]
MRYFITLVIGAAMLLCSCHRKTGAGSRSGTESGYASYYADKYDGRKTSNGEIFRQRKLTAAHKTLPFGTKVKVTNLSNGKTVKVRINDRGPFIEGRIIDLSKAAAKKVNMISAGVAKVKIRY